MKKTFIFILLAGVTFVCNARNQAALIEKIIGAASMVESLSCRFTQTRHVSLMVEDIISEGTMHYEAPDMLKWEYISPRHIVLELCGQDVSVSVDGAAVPPDAKNGRMHKEISRFIMGSVSGNLLKDEKYFDVAIAQSDDRIVAELIPRKGDLRRMFAKIVMVFRSSDYTAISLSLIEAAGDSTDIVFKDTKITSKK